ncbi:unnamed protein product [Pleuronectes platessa]|uniref:Uncharacterized protein n=1 Tax=Pleuronectes platessa TaxID=8262 RepID=A0A9N7Z9M6_PLEPL|nr:unnamed protein product [Pleuronectes platessa]
MTVSAPSSPPNHPVLESSMTGYDCNKAECAGRGELSHNHTSLEQPVPAVQTSRIDSGLGKKGADAHSLGSQMNLTGRSKREKHLDSVSVRAVPHRVGGF